MEQIAFVLPQCADCQKGRATLDKAQTQVARWKKKAQMWERYYRQMKAERDHLEATKLEDPDHPLVTAYQQKCAELEHMRTQLHNHVWEALARPGPGPTDAQLKALLAITHPDKWSAGQDASALAHEVTVLLNQLRDGNA
jgi:hypothetical protein